MSPSSEFGAAEDRSLQVLWADGEHVFCRQGREGANGDRHTVLAVLPAAERPTPASLHRLTHEYALKDDLDEVWAVRPLELVRERGRTMLLLKDPGGEPLDRLIGRPMEIGRFLRLAVALSAVLGRLHERGLVHKDLKPANVLVKAATGQVWLTGFGIASRLPRERQAPEAPEVIAGTLAYMAPEQTGRMNRSIDSRSDLYALGVTLYEMLTGHLPFTASDPMEWMHCHIARQPVPPSERVKHVPVPVSQIIMKLLAKTAEDRYQTAAGLESDLRRCLAEWDTRGCIDAFPLGEHDTPDRLLIPEKLYGRAREIETLLAAFDRIVKSGAPELVLVSGYSGIGKSSVVNELHKVLVPPRGLFAAGKFDQYKRDIPYATLAQGFQSLIRPLLGKSDAELSGWRDALREALGPNGQLMVDLVPELKLIIGDQPPVSELPPQDAQRRFQLVFRRFIGVFARPEHPLALFLDDLQWLDAATLDLLEDLLVRSDLQHLLLIGAYRDNEVTTAHPLMRKLDAIKSAGGKVAGITLAPLAREHLGQLIADALCCEPTRAAPLAQLVHDKTGGNPFFAIQFISSLGEEGMLTFDYDAGRWSWDLDRVHAKGYTDNVVDLMVGKLTRLPAETQTALRRLACLGNSAEIATLSIVLGTSEEQVHAALWPAIRQELVERLAGAYRFVHDRVEEAAYSLLPVERRGEAHLRIGRLLAAHTPPEKREEAIFDIVNQLNRGAALIISRDEREQLAELNLLAGKRARASAAYASALRYLTIGAALLSEGAWERRHEVIFELELHRAECEFLTSGLAEAENRLMMLSTRAADTVERATVTCLLMDVHTTLGQSSRAVAVGLDYLRHLGIEWLPHPTDEEVRREYDRIWSQLGGRAIEELIELPLMSDPASLATLDVLIKLWPPASFTNVNLFFLTLCKAVNLSLERGNSDGSCAVYERFGTVAGGLFGDYQAAFRFGRLGCDLVEQRRLRGFQARVYDQFGTHVLPWTRHVTAGRDFLRRAFEDASKIGDLTYAAYSRMHLNTNMLVAGDPLVEVQGEAEHGLAYAQKMQFGLVIDVIATQLALVRTLRRLTRKFGCLDDEQFDELQIERRFASNPDLAYAECWYWIRKLQSRFLSGDCAAAVDTSLQAQRLLWTSLSTLEMVEYHFYSALSRAACCDSDSVDLRQQHLEALAAHRQQIEVWAEHCPENFENRAALVGAEIARVEGRAVDAMRLYQRAIRSARTNGFVQNEALAFELAARFYAAEGFEEIAHLYMRSSRHCYLRWGADGKVWQLDELYPYLLEDEPVPGPTKTIGAPVEHLDLATVIKVSQAVSGEIVLEKLLDTLMRTAMAQAGAGRVLLILARGAAQQIAAEATTRGDTVTVQLRDEAVAETVLPESVLYYVLRTRESVILDDAAAQSPFAADPYIRQCHARSVLCLPLLNQAKLIGVLYLENNLAPRVFAPARLAVLKLLASQAAISLENTRLYRDLAEREAKVRRLVEANIIGIFIFDLESRILEANDAFVQMVGYDRDDLVAGRVRWTDLTPPEWRDRHARAAAELKGTGTVQPYEREYLRKDGSRVPALIGSAAFDEQRDQGVAFVLDLTERKRAEESLHKMQMELAHANRVATVGQLTASIAHEVKQPLAATVANAQAALRWLGRRPPDLEEVRQALGRIAEVGHRAGDVVDRIRALIQKAPPRKDRTDLNAAIREVIEFTRGEAVKNGISVRAQLAEGLPLIHGDRVQLQQVVLNLIINAVEAMSGVSERVRDLLISTGKAESGGVLVAVMDSGPGLASASLERLFDAFYTTKPGGLGMGLSICRSIIDAHGGRLWASANEPRGTVFQFTLAADQDETTPAEHAGEMPMV
jgi:PAS domain S-box-containing protein